MSNLMTLAHKDGATDGSLYLQTSNVNAIIPTNKKYLN